MVIHGLPKIENEINNIKLNYVISGIYDVMNVIIGGQCNRNPTNLKTSFSHRSDTDEMEIRKELAVFCSFGFNEMVRHSTFYNDFLTQGTLAFFL